MSGENLMTTLEIAAPEFVRRFQSGEIPSDARVTVTYEDAGPRDAALALIEQWLAEAPTDANRVQEAEVDLREVKAALNATRESAGARLLFASENE